MKILEASVLIWTTQTQRENSKGAEDSQNQEEMCIDLLMLVLVKVDIPQLTQIPATYLRKKSMKPLNNSINKTLDLLVSLPKYTI
jgi:hypothetical protein